MREAFVTACWITIIMLGSPAIGFVAGNAMFALTASVEVGVVTGLCVGFFMFAFSFAYSIQH